MLLDGLTHLLESQPKVIFLPGANILYSQLKPEKGQWVMENCCEKLFDLINEGDYKIGFEASGTQKITQITTRIRLEAIKSCLKE